MQQVERKAAIANDVGQLGIDQVSEFRAYLVACGFMARDGSGDQFFHVRRPDDQSRRWIPIERGRGGVPKTPGVLRKYLDAFLSAPASPFREAVVSSARLASVPGTALELPVEAPAQLVSTLQAFKIVQADDAQYLSDLRDDLALHAPLVKRADESVHQFAVRRWEYADVMLITRSVKYGD